MTKSADISLPLDEPGVVHHAQPVWRACGAAHVAVYGTLRAGCINDIAKLRPGIACQGKTLLTGTLYDLGWYPGLVLHGEQAVLAEVYPMDDALEQAMDGIEGLWPQDLGEYRKRVLTLPVMQLQGGQQPMALLVYEARPATVRQAPVIAASDWRAWMRSKGAHPGMVFQLNTVQASG
ncbi:gamma-glutamylcyclotransferase [Comamonas sp. GB3 AK4-5]|uniref:gamma-glutamylcyclotransferase family protein n=1 Tax=Comamonas sp. GB3 AK4-5 TaxID=3231487 RepID=UPI00351E2D1B